MAIPVRYGPFALQLICHKRLNSSLRRTGDRAGRYQYLVLPLARVSGIESPALQAPDAPNYFADAWAARFYVEAALHASLPRDSLSLVVNSAPGRSQDQSHIHVDCIRPDVRATLRHLLPAITEQWHPLSDPLPPHRHDYQARWVDGETLAVDPFKVLAEALPHGDTMASHSLVVVGAYSPDGHPGFILLSGHADPAQGDRGSGDEGRVSIARSPRIPVHDWTGRDILALSPCQPVTA